MIVANAGDDGFIGEGVAFRCFRGGFEQSRDMLEFSFSGGSVDMLTWWWCLRL